MSDVPQCDARVYADADGDSGAAIRGNGNLELRSKRSKNMIRPLALLSLQLASSDFEFP